MDAQSIINLKGSKRAKKIVILEMRLYSLINVFSGIFKLCILTSRFYSELYVKYLDIFMYQKFSKLHVNFPKSQVDHHIPKKILGKISRSGKWKVETPTRLSKSKRYCLLT